MISRDDDLRAILSDNVHELFAAYGLDCAAGAGAGPDDDQVCALLGFTGDHLRGSVVVVADAAALATSNPIAGGGAAAWAAELVNQLVGRFKNRLLRHGVEITLSIPVVLTATRVWPASRQGDRAIRFGVGGGAVTVWLESEGDVVLSATPDLDSVIAAEGDVTLF